jgi:hypothetical protein
MTKSPFCLPLLLTPLLLIAGCNTNDLQPLKLHAPASAVMQGGNGVLVSASGGKKTDSVTWRLLPGSAGTLTPREDTRSAIYMPEPATAGTPAQPGIEAKMGSDTQTLTLPVQSSPASETIAALPAWWQATVNNASSSSVITGQPRAFAPDGAGGYYVAYAAPVAKVVRVKPGEAPADVPGLVNHHIIGTDKDGALYLVESKTDLSITVRKRTRDGNLTVLTRTAPHDGKRATVDGAAGIATVKYSRLSVDSAGNLYAQDEGKVRKIAADGSWSTLAGDGCGMGDAPKCPDYPVAGKGNAARLPAMSAIASDAAGSVYVASAAAIVKITQAGDVTIVAGGRNTNSSRIDASGADARFLQPMSMALDTAGNLLVLDHDTVRRVTPAGVVSTVAAGVGAKELAHPESAAVELRLNGNNTIDFLRAVDIRRVKVQ